MKGLPAWERAAKPGFRRTGGFSLIEVLVSFAILALSLGAIYQVLGGGMRSADRGRDYSRAVLHANSLMHRVGTAIEVTAGELSGKFEDGYRWRVAMTPLAPETEATGLIPSGSVPLFAVSALVEWEQGGRRREFSLDSIRMGTR